ncbi:MAG: hypothetical protein JSW58_16095, partial [Candidatus Latescibacterota bacterium]
CVFWLADLAPPGTVGTTPTGITITSFPIVPLPPNTVPLCHVIFQWLCDDCAADNCFNMPITAIPHPVIGSLRGQCTNMTFFTFVGLTSLVCSTVPAEENTWGKVKALYVE